jgi:hypothetical protein
LLIGLAATFGLAFAGTASAQLGADNSPAFGNEKEKEPQAKNVREMLVKLQIEKEKKEHDQMLERGEEVLSLSKALIESYGKSGTLTTDDREKLTDAEKLVKKIRGELGGEDDDTVADEDKGPDDVVGGVKAFASATSKLLDELKKTTRFSISAAAIQSSNSVLRVIRFLKGN